MRVSTPKPALLAVLVILVGVVALLAVAPAEVAANDHEDDDNQTYTAQVMYWSLDAEVAEEDAEYGFWEGMSRNHDRTWEDPTNNVQDWNKENVREFAGGNLDRSIHPEAADLEDSGRIKDAYIEIHSISPMTIAHLGEYRGMGSYWVSEQSQYNYIRTDSDVNVVWDYRIHAPTTRTTNANPPDGSDDDHENDTVTYRRVENYSVEEIRMEFNGDTYAVEEDVQGKQATLSPSDDPSENTEFPTYNSPSPITVTAEMTSNVKITEWSQEEWCDPCHDHDKTWYDDKQSAESCPWSSCDKSTGHDHDKERERDGCDEYENETKQENCVDYDYKWTGHDHDKTYYNNLQTAEECTLDDCNYYSGHDHDITWYEEWSNETRWDNDTVTVSDQSRDVTGYYVGASIDYAHMPDGSTQFDVYQYGSGMTPIWDGVTLPDGSEANTIFQYYTTRDTGWDVINASTASGTDTIRTEEQAQPRAFWFDHSRLRPMELHAYPSSQGTFVGGEGAELDPIHTETFGLRGPPELHENVTVNNMDEEYEVVNRIVTEQTGHYELTYHEDEQKVEELTIKGIVPGTTAEVYSEPDQITVYEPKFEVEPGEVDRDAETITYTVSVEANGTAINTADRDGENITINNETYQTDENGEVTITVNYEETSRLYLDYNAQPWYEYLNTEDANSDTRLVDASETVTVTPAFHDEMMLIAKILYLGVVPWLPFLLFVWLFDRILDLGIWPPWRRFF